MVQGDDIYDAMLNQTNVGNNNNKFYALQLLGHLSINPVFSVIIFLYVGNTMVYKVRLVLIR